MSFDFFKLIILVFLLLLWIWWYVLDRDYIFGKWPDPVLKNFHANIQNKELRVTRKLPFLFIRNWNVHHTLHIIYILFFLYNYIIVFYTLAVITEYISSLQQIEGYNLLGLYAAIIYIAITFPLQFLLVNHIKKIYHSTHIASEFKHIHHSYIKYRLWCICLLLLILLLSFIIFIIIFFSLPVPLIFSFDKEILFKNATLSFHFNFNDITVFFTYYLLFSLFLYIFFRWFKKWFFK